MTGPPRTPLLDLAELSAHARGAERPLLDGVALTVRAGTVTAVVGPSGSGKTTLGLAALGAAPGGVRLTGRVLLEGTDLLRLEPAARSASRAGRAAHLPQHPETVLDPVRRVGGALRELAALGHPHRGARTRAAHRALARVGLEWDVVRRRFPHQLSGGQQQRLALASTLVTGAGLLVLDEPTSGLDPALAHDLGRTLRALADRGTAVLLLSHDLPLVRRIADRTLVLERGTAVDEGQTADLLGTGGPVPASAPSRTATARPSARPRATRDLLAAEASTERRATPVARAAACLAGPGTVAADGLAVQRRSGHPLTGPVSMVFPPGSRTALLGPSGSGKTTFARALAGLTAPSRGEVRLDGRALPRRIDRRTAAQRRAVQYVHQSSADSFEEHRPLLEQLADTARLLHGVPKERARVEAVEAAASLGLEEAALRRTPGRLSGGQLQRCALVRALTARPALLICDEVTSALDTVSREQLLDTLPRLLAPAGTALLFISHDLPAVRILAQDAALFESGCLLRRGPVSAVLSATWQVEPVHGSDTGGGNS
ncbi:ATP-binding cassette domain-containing protein [Streptomyces sp. WMMB303]|uniref:ABC transporter ATP-binding protein n=1 Tax=Streptomyces sp. WMMB303 TaxID=3034154 RepID=UPI0023EACF43|nr:ATP-binding cassette domain-containing protein [Streptomyces sp. WMMB303]MDF4251877.1 ATP-binding cassette domain-containing protein [Streptomyces sp. WMMB303]